MSKAGREELEEAINRVLYICHMNQIPVFVSAAVKNSDEGTEYINSMFSSTANAINLKDDRIRKYMLIANGYEPVPPREVVDFDIDEMFPKDN